MKIGQIARKIFGKHFHILGKIYRSIFVDLKLVAHSISPYIPKGATIVDVGGGDGELLNYLLSLRHDIRVQLIDTSPCIGNAVKKEYLAWIELYPATSMEEFSIIKKHKPDVILLSDVIHHIAIQARKEFFSELRAMVDDEKEVRIIVKDVEPGYFRSLLGVLSDRYISGDKTVSLIERASIPDMMKEILGSSISMEETNLFELDKPNYVLIFVRNLRK